MNNFKIAIVDDCQGIREAVAEVLAMEGYSTVTFCDGEAALQAIRSGMVIDLVFLDLMMPRKSGWDVLREIREKDLKTGPVIVLSAVAYPADFVQLGAIQVVPKPFDIEAILDITAYHYRAA
ncbi:MAG: response regulator transcription factor [Proteobacteria bacterium]|nr:MAG: response regulator transcription factor [Pseudomonadota bacterium]